MMTRQQALDEAVRRVVTPFRARWIIRDVDDAEIGFENFPITIAEVAPNTGRLWVTQVPDTRCGPDCLVRRR